MDSHCWEAEGLCKSCGVTQRGYVLRVGTGLSPGLKSYKKTQNKKVSKQFKQMGEPHEKKSAKPAEK